MNHLLGQLIPLIPTILTGFLTYRLTTKKSKHQEDEDALKSYYKLYLQMKDERDELQKQLTEMRNKNGLESTNKK